MYIKKISLFLIATACLCPILSVSAADQRCFTREQCETARKGMGDMTDGFYATAESAEACGNILEPDGTGGTRPVEMGFCLPVGKSTAQIAFGGKKEFTNLGDYIKNFYNYSIVAAIALAIVMIIIAGFQWAVSGGNSQVITSAQKRIGGAIVGLLLAVGAYTILNTISPSLVQLRLPQIWLLNTVNIAPTFCHYLDGQVAQALTPAETSLPIEQQNQKLKENPYEKAFSNPAFLIDAKKATCGGKYYVKEANGQMCTGAYCNNDKENPFFETCYKDPFSDSESKKFSCEFGNIMGVIYNNDIKDQLADAILAPGVSELLGTWEWPWVNELEFFRVCQNGTFTMLDYGDEIKIEKNPEDAAHQKEQKLMRYALRFLDYEKEGEEGLKTQSKKCEDDGGLKGFLINLEFDKAETGDYLCDQEHFIGIEQNGVAVDILGFQPLNSACMTSVIGKLFLPMIYTIYDNTVGAVERIVNPTQTEIITEHLKNVDQKYFISEAQLREGVIININANSIYEIDLDEENRDKALQHYKSLISQ